MATNELRRALLLSTALIALTAAPALAQGAKAAPANAEIDCKVTPDDPSCVPAKAGDSTYLSPLTVSGTTAGTVGDPYAQPKALNVVSADEINQFGGQNLDNALRAQAGVFTHDNPQNQV